MAIDQSPDQAPPPGYFTAQDWLTAAEFISMSIQTLINRPGPLVILVDTTAGRLSLEMQLTAMPPGIAAH